MVLLLVVYHVVVANLRASACDECECKVQLVWWFKKALHPNRQISRPEHRPLVLEALKELVGVDDVLLGRIRGVDVEELSLIHI